MGRNSFCRVQTELNGGGHSFTPVLTLSGDAFRHDSLRDALKMTIHIAEGWQVFAFQQSTIMLKYFCKGIRSF